MIWLAVSTDCCISILVNAQCLFTKSFFTLHVPHTSTSHERQKGDLYSKETRGLSLHTTSLLYPLLLGTSLFHHLARVPAHVAPDPGVVQQTLDLADSRDSNVTIPQLSLRELHDVLLSDSTNNALNLLRSQATAGGDDLAANVLCGGGGAIQRQKDGSLELGLGALGLGLADVE